MGDVSVMFKCDWAVGVQVREFEKYGVTLYETDIKIRHISNTI